MLQLYAAYLQRLVAEVHLRQRDGASAETVDYISSCAFTLAEYAVQAHLAARHQTADVRDMQRAEARHTLCRGRGGARGVSLSGASAILR